VDKLVGDYFSNKFRQSAKIGKILRQILPEALSDDKVAYVVTELTRAFLNYSLDIVIESGEAVRKRYSEKGYSDHCSGPLHNSCMRYTKCQSFFSVYEQNPNSVQIVSGLIGDRVAARALLWKAVDLDNNPITILDRIYYSAPMDEAFMRNWGFENGYLVRNSILDFSESASAKSNQTKFKIPVEKWRFQQYPYMDTFCWINKTENCLQNFDPKAHYRKCQSQSGEYLDSDNDYAPEIPDGHVWIPERREAIPLVEAIELDGTWYRRADCVQCTSCNAFARNWMRLGPHQICTNHLTGGSITIGKETWVPCKGCGTYTIGELCKSCETKFMGCACGAKFEKKYVYAVGDKRMCVICFMNTYSSCYGCGNRFPKTELNTENHCNTCQV
jgi:hypothetical protein